MDWGGWRLCDPEQRGGAVVTQRCVGSAREHSSHPLAFTGQFPAPDGIHAAMDRMQTPSFDPVLDSPRAVIERLQLGVIDDSVLLANERPDEPNFAPLTAAFSAFFDATAGGASASAAPTAPVTSIAPVPTCRSTYGTCNARL
jgi:hypothetical protein